MPYRKPAYQLLVLLFCSHAATAQYGYDTVNVYFPINISTLDQQARHTLDSVVRIAGSSRQMLIYGYADYLGNEPANSVLATDRASKVKNYLLSRKIAARRIPICAGIGEVKKVTDRRNAGGWPEDRRVAIFLQRSSTTATAKTKPRSGIRVTELPADTAVLRSKPGLKPIAAPRKPSAKMPAAGLPAVPPLANNRFEQLADMEVNEVMRIETIHFQPTRHFITAESEPILGALYSALLRHPALKIRIEGHVCCIQADGDALDTDTREFNLSVNRARYIYDYLVGKGIAKERLEYAGFGKTKPIIAVERSEEDAIANRRVEFRILSN